MVTLHSLALQSSQGASIAPQRGPSPQAPRSKTQRAQQGRFISHCTASRAPCGDIKTGFPSWARLRPAQQPEITCQLASCWPRRLALHSSAVPYCTGSLPTLLAGCLVLAVAACQPAGQHLDLQTRCAECFSGLHPTLSDHATETGAARQRNERCGGPTQVGGLCGRASSHPCPPQSVHPSQCLCLTQVQVEPRHV